MSILNYFFIGVAFTFIIDVLLSLNGIKNNPKIQEALKSGDWNLKERTVLTVIWPIGLIVFTLFFIVYLIRPIFKK